jgi:hypothetical protein
MEKVPVGRSIAHAYQFLFGRFFQIIGTAWMPAAVYAGALYVFLQGAPNWLAPLTQNQDLLIGGLLALGGLIVAAFVVKAILGISLTQEALGIRRDFALAHFVLGPRELRLIFAMLRLVLIIIALSVVVALVVAFGLKASVDYGAKLMPAPLILGKPPVAIGALVLAVVIYIAYFLAVLRLSFLLAAVASVEKHVRVARSWALARGSSWRIVLVLIGILLPLAVAGGIAMHFLVGAEVAGLPKTGDAVARLHAVLQLYAGHAGLFALASAIGAVLSGALLAGATATAYRAVTGHEEDESEDDDALVAPLIAPVHGHDDHGGHEDHGHGGHDDHGHDDHGHDDHGHGGHNDHGHGDHGNGGHDDHHGHDDHGHGGHDDHGHGGHDDDGHGGHDDHAHGGHDDHAHGGHDDHGHGGHDGHGHDDHGHGGHDDHGGHGHDDHGHGSHDDHHGKHHHARAA